MADTRARIIVVGAGITGASIAFHLANRGLDVTVIEQGLPASGATGSSFAWIGRPAASRQPSADLRYLALDDYRRLAAALPGFPVTWPGSLMWDYSDPDEQGAIEIRRDVQTLEPKLDLPTDRVQYRPEDGSVDPIAATERLLDEAQQRGAELRLGEVVIGLDESGGRVSGVHTTTATLAAELVILACGVGSGALCRQAGFVLPVTASPTVLVRLDAPPHMVHHILQSPDVELRQLPTGELLSPVEYSGERTQNDLAATAAGVERRINAMLRDGARANARTAKVGWRPMPTDGEPIIGAVPGADGLYIAVMHSAITLAAAAGRLIAAEIDTELPAPELLGSRPNRFV